MALAEVVLRDAALERSALGIINSTFGCAGMRCMALPVLCVENAVADEFIDYRVRPVSDWPMAFDAVLDCVPNLPRACHRRLLKRGGHYASTLPNGWTYTLDPVLNRMGRLQRHAVMLQPDERAFAELLAGVSAGKLRCEIAGEFPLEDATRAIELSRTGHVAGKIVIRVA